MKEVTGRTSTFGGPHAGHVFETAGLDYIEMKNCILWMLQTNKHFTRLIFGLYVKKLYLSFFPFLN